MINVLERLKDGTKFTFNSWPHHLEIVRRVSYNLSDAREAYAAGLLMGEARCVGEYRQINGADIPEWSTNDRLMSVWFMLKHASGQEDDEKLRNFYALWETQVWHKEDNKFRSTLHVWEIGCKHEYDTNGSRPNYGYNKGKCTKCGHRFLCDSGD